MIRRRADRGFSIIEGMVSMVIMLVGLLGLASLHVVFVETSADHAITIPNAPTTVTGQKIELVIPGAPSGAHIEGAAGG